jgi:DnaJ-class molecular chaperone
MKRIPNQGMINMETHHTGDLIIQFDVDFPPMNFFNDPTILQVKRNSHYFRYLFLFVLEIRMFITIKTGSKHSSWSTY